jgi:8-oxo-dGTP pyrophosphatase MutT (NUDIX family)
VTFGEESSRWTILADRVVAQNPHIRPSITSVDLPDRVASEQHLIPPFRYAMTVVLDEAIERVLLIWRRRSVINEWGWELPSGQIDPGQDGAAAAARKVEEETGYRPRAIEHVMTFQPTTSTADSAQELYVAQGADKVGTPEADKPEAVRWIPVTEIPALINAGTIASAPTIIGAQLALLAAAQRAR